MDDIDDEAWAKFADEIDPVPTISVNKSMASPETLTKTLTHHFGFSQFRPGQKEAMMEVLHGKDVGIFWATGSGKSLVSTYHESFLHFKMPTNMRTYV
jgi:superfamily II DNA helicase RecQ